MGLRRRWLWLALAGIALVAVQPASGQEAPIRIGVELMVSHASDAPGPIDPRTKRLYEHLRRDFKYQSLRVLQSRRLELAIDEVGSLELPTGKWIRVRPLHVGPAGVLLAVDIEGALQSDMRIQNGHLVVIGAERYRDGKLVISLEPQF